jgi:hypothetical protein
MTRRIEYRGKVLDNESLWCGYYLTLNQKRELLTQTMEQFKKPIKDRLKPFQLVELVRNKIKK